MHAQTRHSITRRNAPKASFPGRRQMVHPQKRPDVRRALDAALGRTMEVRAWLVKLNEGVDRIPFEARQGQPPPLLLAPKPPPAWQRMDHPGPLQLRALQLLTASAC